MIIWINGAFGSGKTHTAYELHRRLDNSYVYDPEEMGFSIAKNMPKNIRKDDFQEYKMFRTFNREMIAYIDDHFHGTIIVPMTITNTQYYEEIIDYLKLSGHEVKHFTLMASPETLMKRLRKRGEGKRSWGAKHIKGCIESHRNSVFSEHIITDEMSLDQVVDYIGKACNLEMKEDLRNTVKKSYDRLLIWKSHIRLVR